MVEGVRKFWRKIECECGLDVGVFLVEDGS